MPNKVPEIVQDEGCTHYAIGVTCTIPLTKQT